MAQLLSSLINTSKAQNAEVFASDVLAPTNHTNSSQRDAKILRVYLISHTSALTAAEFQVSWDSGSNWFQAGAAVPAANVLVSNDIPCNSDSAINFRHTNASARNISCWVYAIEP